MQKTFKKILCSFLAVLLCLTAAPLGGFVGFDFSLTAQAATIASGTCGETSTWILSSDGTLTISGSGYVLANETWDGYESSVKKVVIEEGIEDIYSYVFYNHTNLTSVTFPQSLDFVSSYAFTGCTALKSIDMPGVTYIGQSAFEDCTALETVRIGDNDYIGEYAFYNCSSLKTLYTGKMDTILHHAFDKCTSLTDVYFAGSQKDWYRIYERHFYGRSIRSATIHFETPVEMKYKQGDKLYFGSFPQTMVEDAEIIKQLNANKDNWVYVEDTYKNTKYAETELGNKKYRSTLDGNWFVYEPVFWVVVDPANGLLFADVAVDRRARSTSSYCSFTDSDLRKWLNEDFASQAFTASEAEKIITTKVRNDSFDTYDWAYESYPDTVETIFIPSPGELTNAVLGFSSYPDADYDRQVSPTDYSVGKKVSSLSTYNQKIILNTRTSWDNLYVETTASIETGKCWADTQLGVRPAMYVDLENIECNHVYKEKITAATCIKDGYTTYTCKCGYTYTGNVVEAKGHSYSSRVTTAATHTKEGLMTYTCSCGDTYTQVIPKIEEHNYKRTVTAPTCTEDGYTTYTCECGDTFVEDYVDANGHSFVDGICEDCSEIEIIASGDCNKNIHWTLDGLGTLTVYGNGEIPDNMDYRTSHWYDYKDNIKKVVISDGITAIGQYSFSNLSSVTEATVASSVNRIDSWAFAYCSSLESITLSEGLEIIDSCAFRNCGLKSVNIPGSVKTIGGNCFWYCESLEKAYIAKGKAVLEGGVFSHCIALKEVYIEGCAEMNGYNFDHDTVKEIYIGDCDKFDFKTLEACEIDRIIFLSMDCEMEYSSLANNSRTIFYGYTGSTLESYAKQNKIIFVPIDAEDDYVVFSDTVGDNATCEITKGGTISFKGTGEIDTATWRQYEKLITKVNVENGITNFWGKFLTNVTEIYLPATVKSIELDSIDMFTSLADVYYYGTEEEWDLFAGDDSRFDNVSIHFHYCPKNENGHRLTGVETDPTCTAQGYTTYSCECGYVKVSDYTDMLEHPYKDSVYQYATHTSEGLRKYTCSVCGDYYYEAIEKLPEHTYSKKVTAPTCTAQGYTTFTCVCGDTYVGAYTDVIPHTYTSKITTPATHTTTGVKTFTCSCGDTYTEETPKLSDDHSYTSEITTQSTCTKEGVKTFTCACGDSYTKPVAKIPHTYTEKVTAPTCTTMGYTTYTCDCGYSYKADYVSSKGHSYKSEITKQPTHNKTGVRTYTCGACGASYNETVAKVPHTYTKKVTAPTCTAQGYTTYTCECGYSYKDNYVAKISHSYTSKVTTPATHLVEGMKTYTCSGCGDSYTEVIAKIKEHNYNTVLYTVEPTCEEEGYTVYLCECGNTNNGDKKAATGHNYSGDTCVDCGESKTENCSCNCHKSGFMGIIWKIINFFNKIFGSNKTCACGAKHY